MGMFSWNTADTNESVANIYSGHERAGKTVYLLQPNNQPAIVEPSYEGYGDFGGVDAYAWMARQNVPVIPQSLNDGDVRSIGIALHCGIDFYVQNDYMFLYTNSPVVERYLCNALLKLYNALNGTELTLVVADDYSQALPQADGLSLNELAKKKGVAKHCSTRWFPTPYPIKLSYNKNARYEDLPESKSCGFQGYFYDD